MSNNISIYGQMKMFGRKIKWDSIHYAGMVRLHKRTGKLMEKIQKRHSMNLKIKVIFLMQYPEMWNSEKSVYESMVQDDRFETEIITIPKQAGVNYSENRFMDVNEASQYCDVCGIGYREAFSGGEWIDLKNLSPDFIFIQRPYDECMPAEMSLKKISKIGILCYIPYGYDFNDIHFPIEYNINFFNNVGVFFADSTDSFKFVNGKYRFDSLFGSRKCFNVGYPRFDLIIPMENDINIRKNVLWIPRWSVDDANDRSYFFDYLDILVEYFESHIEMNLIIRPHPLMFKNFIEKGVMTNTQINELQTRIKRIPNIWFDTNTDYLDSFEQSDLMISDFSSLMIEYFVSLKPIIFCGENIDRYTQIGKMMMDGVYKAKNASELICNLDMISRGRNIYFDRNKEMLNSIYDTNKPIGLAIKNCILQLVEKK